CARWRSLRRGFHKPVLRRANFRRIQYHEDAVPKSQPLTPLQTRLISKALADTRRNEILQQVAASPGGVSCTHLRECQSVTAATLSHHLKELETAGLLTIVRKG